MKVVVKNNDISTTDNILAKWNGTLLKREGFLCLKCSQVCSSYYISPGIRGASGIEKSVRVSALIYG